VRQYWLSTRRDKLPYRRIAPPTKRSVEKDVADGALLNQVITSLAVRVWAKPKIIKLGARWPHCGLSGWGYEKLRT